MARGKEAFMGRRCHSPGVRRIGPPVQLVITAPTSTSPGRLGTGRTCRRLRQNGRMDLGLDGRVYLVTGGSRGLGFAAAQALVTDGARVVLSAPHEGTASSAVARLAQDATAAEPAAWVIADNADPAPPGG